MLVHEYQAKQILANFGVPVPRGILALTPDKARVAAERLGGSLWVVKAQVHAGGRGKGGGVRVCKSTDEVRTAAAVLLDPWFRLVTPQTGPEGRRIRKVYVEEGISFQRELYLGLVVDRDSQHIVLMGSTEGGVDIEEVANKNPDAIHKEYIDFSVGLQPFQMRNICKKLGLTDDLGRRARALMAALYDCFVEKDASLLEINPLVVTEHGLLCALDAKMNFDDNALFRHPDIAELRDPDEVDPAEQVAYEHDLSYVKLSGDIGNMVNGAGLAMATMDIIAHYGGTPANFLDVGGSAGKDKVKAAFQIIQNDNVKAILVNIFGGITRCDVIACGIVEAIRENGLKVPLVVRLQGTNAVEGRRILQESGFAIRLVDSIDEAARAVVAASRGE